MGGSLGILITPIFSIFDKLYQSLKGHTAWNGNPAFFIN